MRDGNPHFRQRWLARPMVAGAALGPDGEALFRIRSGGGTGSSHRTHPPTRNDTPKLGGPPPSVDDDRADLRRAAESGRGLLRSTRDPLLRRGHMEENCLWLR
jgi:hypothetical protein